MSQASASPPKPATAGQSFRRPAHERAIAGVQPDRRCIRGQQDDRLQPRARHCEERSDREQLRLPRPPRERLRRCPRREHEQRVEEHLGHHEPRVGEARHGNRQRGREQGRSCRHERACPQEHGHRRERHRQRLEDLQHVVPGVEPERGERETREQRRQQGVVRRRPAEDVERAVLPEPAPEQGVDHLVRSDPRHRHLQPRPGAERGRDDHERRKHPPGAARRHSSRASSPRSRSTSSAVL